MTGLSQTPKESFTDYVFNKMFCKEPQRVQPVMQSQGQQPKGQMTSAVLECGNCGKRIKVMFPVGAKPFELTCPHCGASGIID